MRKNILFAIYIILILILLKFVCNILVNNKLINKYNNGEYSENLAKSLFFLNIQQPYIADYNYGNVLYQNEKYEEAIKEYEKALKKKMPEKKECDVRINYALAICKTVQVDEDDEQSINEAIKKYESAIDVLLEKGCASEDGKTGHNSKSEQLKKDIEEEIERLKELLEKDDEDEKDDKDNKDKKDEKNENKTEKEIQNIEVQIQKIKDESTKEQRNSENRYKDYNNDFLGLDKNW